ncbi:MAG: nucleotidyltransferase family protein [Tistlia sp.]|uniref:nucleotidyltransferase family protein n=1 Tax=Tistlia sp. TaxID=3057121 RepID=UPI0034A35814
MTSRASSRPEGPATADPAGGALAAWRRIATGRAEAPLPPGAGESLAAFTGAAGADWLLGPEAGLDPGRVEASRLFNRFARARHESVLADILEAGIPIVALKGFASAYQLFPDPDLRAMGDLDLLVRPRDRDRLIALLASQGFAFQVMPTRPWGFISTASYQPFVSPDGTVNLDIHVAPDCAPVPASLSVEQLFAEAQPLPGCRLDLRGPAPNHAFLLFASNAAKDKFGRLAVKKAVDALLLLLRRERAGELAVDWPTLAETARRGRYLKPIRVFLTLLGRFGADLSDLPDTLRRPPTGLAGRELDRVVRDWDSFFARGEGLADYLRRELLLTAEPSVALANNWARLKGLVRPRSGLPRRLPAD